jgi:hypothetical protein
VGAVWISMESMDGRTATVEWVAAQAEPMAVCDVRTSKSIREMANGQHMIGMLPVELRLRPGTPGVAHTCEH